MARAHIGIAALTLALAGIAAPAQAEGLGAEANYGRANGHWGTEIGAGYALDFAGFRLSPGGGVYLRDGETAFYGRVEGTFALPMTARAGVGVRLGRAPVRP